MNEPGRGSDPARQRRRWLIARRWVVYPYLPVLVVLLVFGMPVLGNLAWFFLLAEPLTAGCATTSNGLPVNCFFNGVDVGGLSAGYGLGVFLLGLFNPILVIDLVAIVLPKPLLAVWSVAAVVVEWRVRWLRRQLSR